MSTNGDESSALLHTQKMEDEQTSQFQSATITLTISIVVIFVYLAAGTFTFWGLEDWTFIDSLYFMSVTLTTVGYGDLVPTRWYTQALCLVFILIGIGMIGVALGVLGDFIIEREQQMMVAAIKKEKQENNGRLNEDDDDDEWDDIKAAIIRLLASTVMCVLLVVGGAVFFVLVETDLDFFQAIFYSIVTLTTVGYGKFAPTTQLARAAAVPFVLVGTLLFVGALGSFAQVYVGFQQRMAAKRLLKRDLDASLIETIDCDGDGGVDYGEFLEFMLLRMNKIEQDDIDEIKARFKALDADGSGTLDREDIELLKKKKAEGLNAV